MGQKGNGDRGRNGRRRPTGTRKEEALDAWSAKTSMGMGRGNKMEDRVSKREGESPYPRRYCSVFMMDKLNCLKLLNQTSRQ